MAFPNKSTQFRKGQSGNPNGRPKGSKNRSTIARQWLDMEVKHENTITGITETLSNEEIITLALIAKAMKGDVQAYKQLMDSAYGSPTQTIDQIPSITDFDIRDIYKRRE